MRAGLPVAIAFAGTSRVTTAPAPTIAFAPITVPARIVALAPIEAWMRTSVFAYSGGCSRERGQPYQFRVGLGEVIEGMDVVDKIEVGDTVKRMYIK